MPKVVIFAVSFTALLFLLAALVAHVMPPVTTLNSGLYLFVHK